MASNEVLASLSKINFSAVTREQVAEVLTDVVAAQVADEVKRLKGSEAPDRATGVRAAEPLSPAVAGSRKKSSK